MRTPESSASHIKLPLGEKAETVTQAKALWQDSGVIVEKETYYDIRAEGRWSMGPICGWTDASGEGVSSICSGGSVLIDQDARVSLGELIPYLSEQVRRATRNAQSPTVAGKFDPALSIGR